MVRVAWNVDTYKSTPILVRGQEHDQEPGPGLFARAHFLVLRAAEFVSERRWAVENGNHCESAEKNIIFLDSYMYSRTSNVYDLCGRFILLR